MPQPDEIESLMRRCQIGCGGRRALDDAHQIMAECYRAIGALNAEVAHLRHALQLQQASYERELAIERDQLRARVFELEAQCEAGAASEQQWIDWLVQHGLLYYYDRCHRPDGTNGPAWVLRTPAVVNGASCEAWSADTAADALRGFLRA